MFVLLCKTNQLPVFVKTKIKNKFIDCTHFLQSTKFSLSLFTFHSEERLVNNSKRKRWFFGLSTILHTVYYKFMLVYVADVQPLELPTVLSAKLCWDENVRFRFFAKNLGIFFVFAKMC